MLESNQPKSEYESLAKTICESAIEIGEQDCDITNAMGFSVPCTDHLYYLPKNGGVSGVRFRNLLRDREMH